MARRSDKPLATDSIKCPNCGELIPITETLRIQLTEQARGELRQELAQQQKALLTKEKALQEKEARVLSAEADIERRVEEQVSAQQTRLAKDALAKARKEVGVEIKDLQEAAAEKEKKLQEARENELQLRKEKRALDDAKKEFELESARTLDAERQGIRDEAAKEVLEEHRLRDAERDHKLQEALRVNDELRRKLQQGSQQTQGEVLELELENIIQALCPMDEVIPIAKGQRGADVLQRVRTRTGLDCGSILWETKRTKNWSDGWIEKLKNDQGDAKADVAVLVTEILPKEIAAFGFKDGVWVTSPQYVSGVIAALRHALVEVAIAKKATAGKNQTVEALFGYLTGPEFRHRVETILRGFVAIKDDLDEEKRVAARRWAKREKQLELIISSTGGMYGDLQGLIGGSMQPIPALESGDTETDSSSAEGVEDVAEEK